MKIPPNYSEAQVIEIITDAANKLCHKFRFGPYEVDDIKQECFVLALELLAKEKYDGERPLANFLYVHFSNRLKNLKRNKYERLEPPCNKCPLSAYIKKEDKCTAFEEKQFCDHYYKWLRRNEQKKHLMHGENVEYDVTKCHRRIGEGEDEIRQKELEEYINVALPVEYRMDYIKLKAGQKLTQQKREAIEDILLIILEEGGYA